MKKLLLLAFGATVFGAGAALTPKSLDNLAWTKISTDGSIVVSEVYGTMTIYNVKTGTSIEFLNDGEGASFSTGLGNAVSNDGIVLGTTSEDSKPEYWDGTAWKVLEYDASKPGNNMANGITPDGSRICGSLGLAEMTLDAKTMLVPAYWDRNADGSYGTYHPLPYPTMDWTHRVPQYVTAVSISDDGKTIVGQVSDYSGMSIEPIVYKQKADGEWEYSLPLRHLYNPDNVEIPEWPGESPELPQAKNFMTQAEYDQWQADYQAWIQSGYAGDMPQATSYMTDDEKAAFQAAMDAYTTAQAEYDTKYYAYIDVVQPLIESSPSMEFNNAMINAEGTHIYCVPAIIYDDPESWMGWSQRNEVWDVTLADAGIVKYDKTSMSATCVTNSAVLSTTGLWEQPSESFVLSGGEQQSVYDYLISRDPELKEWLDANVIHDIEDYDYTTDQFYTKTLTCTGLAFASRDMNVIAISVVNSWNDDPSAPMTYAYIFDFSQGGVNITEVTDKAEAVEYFNLQGVRVAEPSNGVYIRRQGHKVTKIVK